MPGTVGRFAFFLSVNGRDVAWGSFFFFLFFFLSSAGFY